MKWFSLVMLLVFVSVWGGCVAGEGGGSGGSPGGDETSAGPGSTSSSTTTGNSTTTSTGSGCDIPCGGGCCSPGSICVGDVNGNETCAAVCDQSSACPAQAPCCGLLTDGSGACLPDDGTAYCKCTFSSECSGGCAPLLDEQSNPSGPYVCKPNDGGLYNACYGATICDGSTCCMMDTYGNQFCAVDCMNDSQCGAAHCNFYDNSNTICSGNLSCGP